MARPLALLTLAVLCGLVVPREAVPRTPATYTLGTASPSAGAARGMLPDIPLSRSVGGFERGAIDTLCWGGAIDRGDGVPIAIRGTPGAPVDAQPKWDFEGGPFGELQGWTSTDRTDLVEILGLVPVRRVTTDTFSDPRDTDATITAGGSTASVWFGALDAETRPGCWPGGQGYSNDWGLYASKAFVYGGSGDVTIEIDYFTDSETDFDFAYVYVVDADGVRSPPLNASVNGREEDGLGWSGSTQEGSALGSPSMPAHESILVDAAHLQAVAGNDFEVLLNFDSDPLYSDGLDSFSGILNSVHGPLGVDDVHVSGEGLDDLSDFETPGAGGTDLGDGWTASIDPPIGSLMKVAGLGELDPISNPCACPLSGNVLVAAVIDGSDYAHPKRQNEALVSPPAYVGDDVSSTSDFWIRVDAWLDLPNSDGVGQAIAMHYYPWTCPVTLTTGWTIEPFRHAGQFFYSPPGCRSILDGFSGGIPEDVDSLKIVFRLVGDCEDFDVQDCTGPEGTNQSPYWDGIQLCLTDAPVEAPLPSAELFYQDVFPQTNTLQPDVTVDIHSHLDTNCCDQDQTNADMGDSAVVHAPGNALAEVYLNFRVFPGPRVETGHPWFGEYGGDFIASATSGAQDDWAKARMDTAEAGGVATADHYSTYDWPDGQETFSKIIEDGVLTPGSTIQYFFSTNYGPTPTLQAFLPDTSGGTYLELEVLPGYFEQSDGELLAPCLLYVDAFNAGAQEILEAEGLGPLLGVNVDEDGVSHANWDRYDYIGAATGTPAPLAREIAGDNGMTRYQSLIYRTIVYNTGSYAQEGLRDGDAGLLQHFLVSDDLDRPSLEKGLWLSGNGMASILSHPGRVQSNALLATFAEALLVCDTYREVGCTASTGGDSTPCVRLDGDAGADFPQSAGYSLRGNGCPTLLDFDVLQAVGDGSGNLAYVDQDAGLVPTPYASVSNDQFAPGNPSNFGVVLDGFSTHYLRATAPDFTGEECGDDRSAVYTRTADVLGFLGAALGASVCAPSPIPTEVDGADEAPVPYTRLFRNAPNPFNPETRIDYQLHARAIVTLDVFDVEGRRVRRLVDEVQEPGRYSTRWDGATDGGGALSSGVYWVRMSTSLGFRSSAKVVLLK